MRAKKRIIKKWTVKKYNNEIIEKEKEETDPMPNNEESDNQNLGEKEEKKWLQEEAGNKRLEDEEKKRLEEEAEKELYQMNSKEIPIGIDFGTTNSCIGAFRFGSAEIISNQITGRTTPSIISFFDKEIAVDEQT